MVDDDRVGHILDGISAVTSQADPIAALQEALQRTGQRVPIACVYLYGSRAADRARPTSDYDLGVFLGDAFDRMTNDAEQRTRLEFELADEVEHLAGLGPVDLRILDRAPLEVRGRWLLSLAHPHGVVGRASGPGCPRVAGESTTAPFLAISPSPARAPDTGA